MTTENSGTVEAITPLNGVSIEMAEAENKELRARIASLERSLSRTEELQINKQKAFCDMQSVDGIKCPKCFGFYCNEDVEDHILECYGDGIKDKHFFCENCCEEFETEEEAVDHMLEMVQDSLREVALGLLK